MKGFTFFNPDPLAPYNLSQEEVSNRKRLVTEEKAFLGSVRESIQSGAGLSRILQHREKADLVFISAYSDRSNNENKKQARSLSADIQSLGFGFVQVKDHYEGGAEESYCVINYAEDTDFFVFSLSALAKKYNQDSILVVPKGKPAYFLFSHGATQEVGSDIHVISKEIENYTSLKNHNFVFQAVTTVFLKDSLSPFRIGNSIGIPIYSRRDLVNDTAVDHLIRI